MYLTEYYLESEKGIGFTREQASSFAKRIAGDYNPLHDPENKIFCVPGDLLFSVALVKLGLSQKMKFTFSGMVSDDTNITFHNIDKESIEARDSEDKIYLSIHRSGLSSDDKDAIGSLTRSYVEFSGQTFPHILVPLMQEQDIMINPARPLVIYESMEIDLDHLNITQPKLELTDTSLQVNGKKAQVQLRFCLKQDGDIIGRGAKYMALRGLKPYDQKAIDKIVHDYMQSINK